MARCRPLGLVLVVASMGYGVTTIALAQSPWLPLALLAGALVGACDAVATTIRQAVVQLETPDAIRGRVSAIYQMASRGGPALGDLNIGWIAAVIGPVAALSVGSVARIAYAGLHLARRSRVSRYQVEREPTPRPPSQNTDRSQPRPVR